MKEACHQRYGLRARRRANAMLPHVRKERLEVRSVRLDKDFADQPPKGAANRHRPYLRRLAEGNEAGSRVQPPKWRGK